MAEAAVVCYWFWRETPLSAFTAGETEGLNTLILLLGSLYAVMYAFVIFVIWSQFTEVEKFVMRECDSLDDLLRFSRYVNADSSRALRRAVAGYAQAVLQAEWPALGQRATDRATENCFTTLLTVVIRTAPANESVNFRGLTRPRVPNDKMENTFRQPYLASRGTRKSTAAWFIDQLAPGNLRSLHIQPDKSGTGAITMTVGGSVVPFGRDVAH